MDDSALDLRSPSESYLHFLKFGETQDLPALPLGEVFGVLDLQTLKFWADPLSALTEAIRAHFANHQRRGAQKFFYSGTCNSLLENGLKKNLPNLQIAAIGSDPAEIFGLKNHEGSFFLLGSPNATDSSFWSHELLASVARRLLEDAGAYVLVDESLSSLVWDANEDVGSLRHVHELRLGTLISLEPWSHGETALTLINRCPKNTAGALDPSDVRMKNWTYLHQLWTREFQTGMQLLRLRTAILRNARTLTEEIRDEIQQGLVQCPHWPKAGHSILLRLPNTQPIKVSQRLAELGLLAQFEAADSATDVRFIIPLSGKKIREAAAKIHQLVNPAFVPPNSVDL